MERVKDYVIPNKADLKIVFMGTPEFAVSSLEALVNNGYDVVAVVTAPDKPAGRGMKLQESAVKQFAISKGIPVLQPPKLKNPEFLSLLKDLQPDVQIVVAFRMLPEVVWNLPPLGTINVHGSLLPQYRGAAPINWAIMNGESQTGVTTFRLKHEIDTGNILLQQKLDIGEDESAGSLHDRMKVAGAKLLVETIDLLIAGKLEEKSQPLNNEISSLNLKHAPKLGSSDAHINWHQTPDVIHNLIRGLSPFPGAYTYLNGKMFKIYSSAKRTEQHTIAFGAIQTDGKSQFSIACMDGFIEPLTVQLEGKKRMDIKEFLKGFRMENESIMAGAKN